MDCRIWIGLLLGTMACQLYDGVPLHADTAQGPAASAVDALAGETADAAAIGVYEDRPDAGCSVEQCNGRDDDCDGRIDEESGTATCSAAAAVSVCLAGSCAIVRCLDDSRDCDALSANGCEVDASDPAHCGACGRACRLDHARSTCQADSCRVSACDPGFADCDEDDDNGCEVSLRTHSHCGACGHGCADDETCNAGACQRLGEQSAPPAQPDTPAATCTARPDDSACTDQCPADPAKRAPGACGCGVSDVDTDTDGTPDCTDGCPSGAWTTGPCLPYTPLNLDPTRLDFVSAKPALFNCGTTTVDTTASAPVLSNGCGVSAALHVDTRPDGTNLVVLTVRDLTVAAGSTLRLIGSRPVAIAAFGDVSVDGSIDASANASVGGAGSGLSCAASTGGDGAGNSSLGGGGGGGGGFGTAGGPGGTGDGARAGAGGATLGDAGLVPLRAGCPGGRGGGCSTFAAGGGAVQLSAAGRVTVKGNIRASGAAGARGCGSEGGGSGGGSGGGILIEAKAIDAVSSALDVSGGRGGDSSGIGGSAGTATAQNGGAGQSHHANGGGGGGGGFGRIRLLLH